MELNDREQQILFHVIDDFIANGEPVASRVVAAREEIDVSSATIRNVMGRLEEAGYLVQPHTSAGRVPTALGMRSYVDLLSRFGAFEEPTTALGIDVPPPEEPVAATRWATSLLADLSELAALVLGPDPASRRIRDVRLVALSPRRVLSIFVEDDGGTVEHITTFEAPLETTELSAMQRYLAELGTGCTIEELRRRVRDELIEDRGSYHQFISRALALAHGVGAEQRSDLHVEGAFRVVELADDLNRVGKLLRALEEKERVIQILDQVYEARRPITIIGPETGWDLAEDLSFVLCGFYRGADRSGLVGVLGPMRMDYARVIPLVDNVARVLSTELETSA